MLLLEHFIMNKSFFLFLLSVSSLLSSSITLASQGCLLNGVIYNNQLPNVFIYRSDFYSQEYENYNNPAINTSDVSYYRAPGDCGLKWNDGTGPQYPENTVAQKNGCLINGYISQNANTPPQTVGRTIIYDIVANCPIDDYVIFLLFFLAIFGYFKIFKSLYIFRLTPKSFSKIL